MVVVISLWEEQKISKVFLPNVGLSLWIKKPFKCKFCTESINWIQKKVIYAVKTFVVHQWISKAISKHGYDKGFYKTCFEWYVLIFLWNENISVY